MWVDVLEDMPQFDTRYRNLSIPVDLKMSDGIILHNCYYAYHYETWYTSNSKKLDEAEIIAWRTVKEKTK